MASGHSDPKLLYAVEGINAYQISNGYEQSLTPSGPQTLSLLMVPTSSGFADPSAGVNTPNENGEEDFYLHLHLPPELDLPLPATTQIYHQPPASYLIPRWDLGPDSGSFTRIEFPRVGTRDGVQEDLDTFETILAQCTAFLERSTAPAMPPRSKGQAKAKEAGFEEPPSYNPGDFKAGEAYAAGSQSGGHLQPTGGRIVLVDEEDGSVIGELGEGFQVEDQLIKPGSKDPVVISLPTDGGQLIAIEPATSEYVGRDMHPAYKKSSIVSQATKASQLFVTTSDFVTRSMANQADSFTKSTKPVAKPVTFTPTTHAHIRRINQFSTKAAGLSASTVGVISKYAQNFGATVSRKKDGSGRGYDNEGRPIDTYKPGVLNKSLMAFNTVVDGMEHAGRTLLTGSSASVTTVVGHRWGAEAGEVAKNIGGGFKNVGLVYIDVTGVSRRAILKSVAKGMVVGQVKGGGKVVVGGVDEEGRPIMGEAAASGANGDGASIRGGYAETINSTSTSRPLMGDKKPSKGGYY